jgi:putative transposase
MASEELPVQLATRVLHVAESGYYAWRTRAPSARSVRHVQLTEAITGIHTASRGTYGSRRVHAELALGLGIPVSHGTVELLMQRAGLRGLPGNRRRRPRPETPSAADLVERNFTSQARDQLWVTYITEHPTREGKVYCAVVLDTYSRRVMGWSIDATQTAAPATNALSMALANRRPPPRSTIIHSDHGWAIHLMGLHRTRPRLWPGALHRSIGDCADNALMESFWGRVQTELLNRQRWRTRLELANALFEYLEIFHNRQRRHSALGILTPTEYELRASRVA